MLTQNNIVNAIPKLVLAGCLLCYAALVAAAQTGGWRLADESSPYLQLHADNPVEWYPWGEAALNKARRENKPLFISIGYFTCHWCHVMARESFSNPSIAKLLNEHFVAIKIDREQRPDLDAAYMLYVEITLGRGGWPMSVWATPDGKPFLGGTYYPPESVSGRTGFRELLQRLAALWVEDEPGIRATAQNAVERLELLGRSARPAKLTQCAGRAGAARVPGQLRRVAGRLWHGAQVSAACAPAVFTRGHGDVQSRHGRAHARADDRRRDS